MVEIKTGDSFKATNVKTGTGKTGKPYWMCRVKGDKGYETITVWAMNDCAARDGDTVVLTSIGAIKHGSREYNGKWYADVSVNAEIGSGGFSELPDDDGDLPF